MWWKKKINASFRHLIQHIHMWSLNSLIGKKNPTIQLRVEFIGYIFLAQSETTWKLQNLYVSQLKKKNNKTLTLQPMAWQAVFVCIFCICIYENTFIFIKITNIHRIEMPVVAGDLLNLSPWPDCKSLESSGQPPAVDPLYVCSPLLPQGQAHSKNTKLFN